MRVARTAFTLVEILIASALLLLGLVLAAQVLIPALRISARTWARTELQQRGRLALNALAADLQRAGATGVAFYRTAPSRALLSVHRIASVGADGGPLYDAGLVFYRWEGGALHRSVYRPNPSPWLESPCQPTLAKLEGYLDLAAEQRVLLRDVKQLDFKDADPGPSLRLPLELSLELETEVPGRASPERLVLNRKLFLRNP